RIPDREGAQHRQRLRVRAGVPGIRRARRLPAPGALRWRPWRPCDARRLHFRWRRAARAPQLGRLRFRGTAARRGGADGTRGVRGDPRRGLVMRGLRKVMPVTGSYEGARFLTRREGKLFATPLLAVLIVIETMDLVFAVDSIPAALGVTTDVFIVVTSNAFAVLGLRALYFVLAGAMDRFAFLSTGLAVMLAFIGAKMLLAGVVHIPVAVSLAVIVVVITSALLLSVWH